MMRDHNDLNQGEVMVAETRGCRYRLGYLAQCQLDEAVVKLHMAAGRKSCKLEIRMVNGTRT